MLPDQSQDWACTMLNLLDPATLSRKARMSKPCTATGWALESTQPMSRTPAHSAMSTLTSGLGSGVTRSDSMDSK